MRRKELIAARERAGMSRETLGKALGIHRVQVYRIEEGLNDASPNLMVRWVAALDANPADLWPARDLDRVRRHVREGRRLLDKLRRAAA